MIAVPLAITASARAATARGRAVLPLLNWRYATWSGPLGAGPSPFGSAVARSSYVASGPGGRATSRSLADRHSIFGSAAATTVSSSSFQLP